MPNWCWNTLQVSGADADLQRLRQEVGSADSALDFELILPTPRELLDGQGWYAWRVANWGTKWSVVDVALEAEPGALRYQFDSAWAPPLGILQTLALNYPSLRFELEYSEPGAGFHGQALAAEGRLVSDNCRDYTEGELREMFGED